MSSATVYIVDDDAAVRDGLALLLETGGLNAETFESAEAFFAGYRGGRPGCLVLDVHMEGMNGLELQAELVRRRARVPIVFLTAHGDIPTTVQAMKAGAVDFLTKPVDGKVLLERVRAAVAQSEREHQREARLASLTEREREILALVVASHSNKEIARKLGISHRTVEVHRSHILSKTGASTLFELAQLATAGDVSDVSDDALRVR